MNAYTAVAVVNVSLIALTAVAIWLTGSLWAVLILLFCMNTNSKGEK